MERMSAEANEQHKAIREHGAMNSKLSQFKPSDSNPIVQFWLRVGALIVVIYMVGTLVWALAVGANVGAAYIAAIIFGVIGAFVLTPIVLAGVLVATRDSSPVLIDIGPPHWMSTTEPRRTSPFVLRIVAPLILLFLCLGMGAQHNQYLCALAIWPIFAVPCFLPTTIQLRERGIAYPMKMLRVWEEIESWRWIDEDIVVVISTHPESLFARCSYQTMIAFPVPKEARAKTQKIMLERVGPEAEDATR